MSAVYYEPSKMDQLLKWLSGKDVPYKLRPTARKVVKFLRYMIANN